MGGLLNNSVVFFFERKKNQGDRPLGYAGPEEKTSTAPIFSSSSKADGRSSLLGR